MVTSIDMFIFKENKVSAHILRKHDSIMKVLDCISIGKYSIYQCYPIPRSISTISHHDGCHAGIIPLDYTLRGDILPILCEYIQLFCGTYIEILVTIEHFSNKKLLL